jgi:hypothetical protein
MSSAALSLLPKGSGRMEGKADPPAMQGTIGQVPGRQYLIESKTVKIAVPRGHFFQGSFKKTRDIIMITKIMFR